MLSQQEIAAKPAKMIEHLEATLAPATTETKEAAN
jgi:hypothetical protein